MFAENVNVAHNLCCQIRADDNSSTCTFMTEKSVTFTGACANEIIPSINRSFVYKAKEGCHVRMCDNFVTIISRVQYSHICCWNVLTSLSKYYSHEINKAKVNIFYLSIIQ
jgi:hypothetical protein